VSSIPGSELLTPANFTVNPMYTSRVVGSVSNLTASSSFPVAGGNTITINDGTTTATVTSGGTVSVSAILNAINTTAGLTATAFHNSSGQIQIESPAATSTPTGGTATGPGLPQFGLTAATTAPGTGTVIATDVSTFVAETIDGGAVTGFSSNGTPANVQFRWAKVDSGTYGGQDTWNLFYQTNSNATGSQVAWLNGGTNFTFDQTGQLSPPTPNQTIPA